MTLSDVQIYLPKYLSAESTKELFEELKAFPDNIDKRLYTNYLQDSHIYQGDCLSNLLVVNLPDVELKNANCLVLSNSCDIALQNKRPFPSQIVYTPIIDLERYVSGISAEIKDSKKLENHLDSIRKQQITQIFYLPKFDNQINDSIVFLDRIYNIRNEFIERSGLSNIRLFSLSNYGHYLFLLKLSLHFTRIQDKVDRRSVFI